MWNLICRWTAGLFLLGIPAAVADEVVDDVDKIDGLVFREPFSGLSASEIESKLIVFLITDEDPFQWTKAKLDTADKSRLGGGPDVWCGPNFRRSFQKLFVKRPDLKDRCIAQRVVAGLPANLTANAPRSLPPRAITAICDGQYRLLHFSVGVPEPDDLIQMIEDAEENKTLLQLHPDDPAAVGEAVLDRTNKRVQRVYRESLDRLAEPMSWDESLAVDDAWVSKYARFVSSLNPSYLFDVRLRFELSDTSDLVRLLVLEQHCETRRDWCDSLAPYIVGRPMRSILNPLVDTTWGIPAVLEINKEDHEEILNWFSSRRENSFVVLAIKPTHLDRDITWPPPNISRNPLAKRSWSELETVMSNHPFRSVSAEELAVVLRENNEMSISLLAPTRARYVIFEPEKKKLTVIRESDFPGKFIHRLETK
ncbi:hypothetical protein NZK35_34170 [Stieleria sp. ICT_E10.1]|uniref:hypothetical protein n=1 Tax=Stieleria sedimenti TaxID=2976331 RepID=UPI00217FE02D|nr:hypothetical protein [Stieleria sedimenti]MCS7471720.1 hypothetical protein [Stieleria sedimenti]